MSAFETEKRALLLDRVSVIRVVGALRDMLDLMLDDQERFDAAIGLKMPKRKKIRPRSKAR